MININEPPYYYWSKKELISTFERLILIYSIAYYEKNHNIVEDREYEKTVDIFEILKEKYPVEFKESQYFYVFEDFHKATGFDLFYKLTGEDRKFLSHVTDIVIKLEGEENG